MCDNIYIKTKKGERQRYCKTVDLANPALGFTIQLIIYKNLML